MIILYFQAIIEEILIESRMDDGNENMLLFIIISLDCTRHLGSVVLAFTREPSYQHIHPLGRPSIRSSFRLSCRQSA